MQLPPTRLPRIAFRVFLAAFVAVLISHAWPALAQEAAGSATATVQKTAF